MKYIIMLLIVIMLAIADFLMGLIKACIHNDLCSKTMRHGGLNKLCEMIVMAVSCGLEIGIEMLGRYYDAAAVSEIAGIIAASAVFVYIVLMEIVSIFENYGEISPDAVWVRVIVKRLRQFEKDETKGGKDDD